MFPGDDERLLQALSEDIPGREGDWAATVGSALADWERTLRQHAAVAEDPDGIFAQVDLTRPTLARRVGQLRREHTEFLAQACALRQEVEAVRQAFRPYDTLSGGADTLPELDPVAAVPDLGALRRRIERFLAALRHHDHEEANLVVETVTTDIGVGD